MAVGRLTGEKGFDLLIRAHAGVFDAGQEHELLILGEGPDRAQLSELAEQLGVQNSVRLPGFVANPPPLVAGADLFLLSSRREGMGGLALLEALSQGVPVVATDCIAGPRQLLCDGRLGQLVAVEDVTGLTAAIRRFLERPEDLRSRAQGGPVRARDFDPARAAEQFLETLEEVIDSLAGNYR